MSRTECSDVTAVQQCLRKLTAAMKEWRELCQHMGETLARLVNAHTRLIWSNEPIVMEPDVPASARELYMALNPVHQMFALLDDQEEDRVQALQDLDEARAELQYCFGQLVGCFDGMKEGVDTVQDDVYAVQRMNPADAHEWDLLCTSLGCAERVLHVYQVQLMLIASVCEDVCGDHVASTCDADLSLASSASSETLQHYISAVLLGAEETAEEREAMDLAVHCVHSLRALVAEDAPQ